MTPVGLVGLGLGLGLLATPAHAGGDMFDSVAGGISGMGCEGTGCWTNYLRVQDIDGDGALDMVAPNMGGFFSLPGTAQDLEVFSNDGSGGLSSIAGSAVGGHVGRHRQVAIGDVDGDGDNDMYAPSGSNDPDAFFINDGAGTFTDEIGTRLPGAASNAGAVRFGDVDGDGDLDLVIADGYASGGGPETLHVYANDGAGNFSEIAGAAPGNISGSDICDLDIADFDRDFDLDIYINAHSGPNALWLNDGSGSFFETPSPGPGSGSGFHYNPGVCDVDNDGDLDIMIDNTGGSYGEQLLINDGIGGFSDASGQIGGQTGADDNGVLCADIDDDGDFDAVIVNVGGAASNLRLVDNDGSGNFSPVAGVFPALGCALWAEFGDLTDDGRLDVVVGAGECGSQNRVYHANASVPADATPPVVSHHQAPPAMVDIGAEVPLRYAVRDRFVTDSGPSLDSAYAVLFPGVSNDVVDAVFVGGDLFHVVLPAQGEDVTVTFQLCAQDRDGNLGCSEEISYDVGMGGEPPMGTSSGPGDTGPDPTADGTVGVTDPSAGDASADSSGSGGSSGTADDDGGGGCGCTTTPRPNAVWWLVGLVGLVGLGALLRRRRD